MTERLVQWTLLKDLKSLSKLIGKPIIRKLAEEYTTDLGRIDFALETPKEILVVELETNVDNQEKLSYCMEQVERYQKISFDVSKPVQFAILIADTTPSSYKTVLVHFATKFNILLATYSIIDIQKTYKRIFEELRRTSGLFLGSPVAMDITHLRYLNKIIKPFVDVEEKTLSRSTVRSHFQSSTNFGVYKKLAEDFEILGFHNHSVSLTELGLRFRQAFNRALTKTKATMPDLSREQKRILLESLTNGNFTKCKVNIYYFLRFVHLTNGEWLPRPNSPRDSEKLEFINFLFNKTYGFSTAWELLSFTCNQCEELELTLRIRGKNLKFDQVMLTELGSRVLGFLELHLHLKREQIQIPLSL